MAKSSHPSLYQAILRKFRTVRKDGFLRSARIAVDRIGLTLLQRVYEFHPWHAEAPLSARPYRHVVAELVNGLTPRCVVEVGCGLGSILSLVKAQEKFGYDVDAGAIRAARFLRARGITFVHGDMAMVAQPKIDVLILVNWIHDFSPEELDAWITPLLSRTTYLVLDSIDFENPLGYRYSHSFSFLGSRVHQLRYARAPNEGRRFLVYEVAR